MPRLRNTAVVLASFTGFLLGLLFVFIRKDRDLTSRITAGAPSAKRSGAGNIFRNRQSFNLSTIGAFASIASLALALLVGVLGDRSNIERTEWVNGQISDIEVELRLIKERNMKSDKFDLLKNELDQEKLKNEMYRPILRSAIHAKFAEYLANPFSVDCPDANWTFSARSVGFTDETEKIVAVSQQVAKYHEFSTVKTKGSDADLESIINSLRVFSG